MYFCPKSRTISGDTENYCENMVTVVWNKDVGRKNERKMNDE